MLWTPITSTFLHDSLSHAARQAVLLLLVGGAAEAASGPAAVLALFAISGGGAAVISWLCLKTRLLGDPDYVTENAEQRGEISAVADFAESRGGSAALYGVGHPLPFTAFH